MNIVEPIRSRKDVARVEKFLEGNSKRNRLIFVFGINTGLRVSLSTKNGSRMPRARQRDLQQGMAYCSS